MTTCHVPRASCLDPLQSRRHARQNSAASTYSVMSECRGALSRKTRNITPGRTRQCVLSHPRPRPRPRKPRHRQHLMVREAGYNAEVDETLRAVTGVKVVYSCPQLIDAFAHSLCGRCWWISSFP
jgi:hypothetical protein